MTEFECQLKFARGVTDIHTTSIIAPNLGLARVLADLGGKIDFADWSPSTLGEDLASELCVRKADLPGCLAGKPDLEAEAAGLFSSRTVAEVLLGFTDPLYGPVPGFVSGAGDVEKSRTSGRDVQTRFYTGASNLSLAGTIISLNESDKLCTFGSCEQVKGATLLSGIYSHFPSTISGVQEADYPTNVTVFSPSYQRLVQYERNSSYLFAGFMPNFRFVLKTVPLFTDTGQSDFQSPADIVRWERNSDGAPIRLTQPGRSDLYVVAGVDFHDVDSAIDTLSDEHMSTFVSVNPRTGEVYSYRQAVMYSIQIGALPVFYVDVQPATVPIAIRVVSGIIPYSDLDFWAVLFVDSMFAPMILMLAFLITPVCLIIGAVQLYIGFRK